MEIYWQLVINCIYIYNTIAYAPHFIIIIIIGSNDKSVIVWDLKGNLSFDSELVRRFTPALFLDNHEEVNIYVSIYLQS